MEIYLDNAATTKVCPEAVEAALDAMTLHYGNPSSTHTMGREAKKLLEEARVRVASALGCAPPDLVFTSCGSESDNWAILGGAEAMKRAGRHVISSLAEHEAVLGSCAELERRGFDVTLLSPGPDGAVSVSDVSDAMRPDTILLSFMLVNNETGAVTDVAGISSMLRRTGSNALLHTDAIQGFMKVPFKARTLGADFISISGHKIHAPKGVGALYIRSGLRLPQFVLGGGQEEGRRSGTEAMPGIAAFGAAAAAAASSMAEYAARMSALRELCISRLVLGNPDIVVIGGGAPHILSISLPGYRSEVLMNFLESRGIYVSKSSACKKGGRSHVLKAMGLDSAVIDGAVRIGLSRLTSEAEIGAFCATVEEAAKTLAHS